jgi:hypothetical protein
MSYYNWVNLQYMDDIHLNFELLKEPLITHLDETGIHHAVLKDIEELLIDHEATFKLYTPMIDEIFLLASRLQPNSVFGLQGRGEELRDVWVREYHAGEVTYSQGPFE